MEKNIISVSALNRGARRLLEGRFPQVWVEAEISNMSKPSSGHWYFTLKDQQAQVRCAMFRNRNIYARFPAESGQLVIVRAKVSLYEGRGDYQLIVEHIEEAGVGALQRAFEDLKQKLADEGLFDSDYKQALPEMPKHIGVITSPTGAALQDILSILKRRFPAIAVTVFPVAVQGQNSAAEIMDALALANKQNNIDVLIVGRGGGSIEDLCSFNDENLARALFSSNIPVVSAVGHETDFSIADFVADYRAETPSAAAEMLSPDREEWLNVFNGMSLLLTQALTRKITQQRHTLNALHSRLRHPGQRLQEHYQRLDDLEIRLKNALSQQLLSKKLELEMLSGRLQQQTPEHDITQQQQNLQHLLLRAKQAIEHTLQQRQQHINYVAKQLHSLSPLATLDRGYGIARDKNGLVIDDVNTVNEGDKLTLRLKNGLIHSVATQIET